MKARNEAAMDSRAWKIVALCALAAVIVLAVLLMVDRRSIASSQEQALRKIEQRMAAVEGNTPTAAERGGLASNGAQARIVGTSPPQGQPEEPPQEDARVRARRLEGGFAAQPADPAAARAELEMLETMTGSVLGGTGITARDPDVDCRRDTCRVTAGFRSESEAYDWITYYLTTVGARYVSGGEPAITRNPDGSVQARLYARRATAMR